VDAPRNPEPRLPVIRQRGQAFLISIVLLLVGVSALIFNLATPGKVAIDKDKITADALAQAKAALIGYAAGVNISAVCGPPPSFPFPNCPRPGDLPCPDTNDSGGTGGSCGDAAGSNQTLRLGRLPWKSLGLPDLRDGDGERLWYAVSNNFKYNTRTICSAPGDAGCLNSDTRGTITVRNSAGTVIYNGTNPDPYTPSGVVAVIFAPGAVLQRQDTGMLQVRDCSGAGCGVTGTCNSTATAKCNPINYLDILSGTEDNADFIDGSSANGFINGVIRDAGGNAIVNDRLLVITYNDLMPVLQRRVATEVLNCLSDYAGTAQNNGRYPWAVPAGNYPSFADQANTRFGRVPDTMSATLLGLGGAPIPAVCALLPGLCMSSTWPTTCGITLGGWWPNWKDLVFYGVADAYKPSVTATLFPLTASVPAPGGCGSCLTVDPPSPTANKKVVVVVAGKRLSVANYAAGNNQPRTTTANKQDPTYYLEGTNDNTATSNTYEQQTISNSFSDFLLYQ
jgi:hypothetical protein